MLGGDVNVASVPGQGSTFTLRLPAIASDPSAVDEEQAPVTAVPLDHREPESPSPSPIPAPDRSGVVLVIDDDPNVRDLMQRTLRQDGFHVETAARGDEGLQLARQIRPDAITLDVMMPGDDGWIVLSALKSDPELAEIPVIMVTIVDDADLGYALGASDYLTKPIDRHRLRSIVGQYRRQFIGHNGKGNGHGHGEGTDNGSILVIDDDDDSRYLIRSLLEPEGWSVFEAGDGQVALDRLNSAGGAIPDLIVLDLMMPALDGFSFLHALRREPAWHAIPVVVLTAKDLSADDLRTLGGDVARVLRKGGCSRVELLEELRREMSRRLGRKPRAKAEAEAETGVV